MADVDLALLRKPFDDGQIGKLPRITCGACSKAPGKVCQEHSKARCGECGNWISTQHLHLDYVGHAQVTDRLLDVDPEWSWEPCGWTPEGTPAVRFEQGGRAVLWIKLTIGGVTRLGVGIVGSNKPECEKELIGDALRNAAMRFGVALDLWAKGDLHGEDNEAPAPSRQKDPNEPDWQALGWEGQEAHDEAREAIRAQARELPDKAKDELRDWLSDQGWRFPYELGQMNAWRDKVAELSPTAPPVGDSGEGAEG